MSLSIEIEDGRGGTRNKAAVTTRGQLIVAPIDFSTPILNEMTVNGQAYNFVGPTRNRQFIITDIIVGGDRNVGTGGSEVEIYEATAVDSTVVSNGLFKFTIGKNVTLPITGLNVITNPGTWINAKMDDNNVTLTIIGYVVKTV
jgi:hypothetical protein